MSILIKLLNLKAFKAIPDFNHFMFSNFSRYLQAGFYREKRRSKIQNLIQII